MSDTYTLRLQNFRSIRDATVEIAPLTVVYGQNGSGKSSLLYGLLTLRNFLSNPNQNLPSLFTYPSISLGSLPEVVRGHDSNLRTSFSIGVSNPEELSSTFTLTLGGSGGMSRVNFETPPDKKKNRGDFAWPDQIVLEIAVPYSGNQVDETEFVTRPYLLTDSFLDDQTMVDFRLIWNGIAGHVLVRENGGPFEQLGVTLNKRVNQPMELARQTGFVPLRRGFSKPAYNLSNVTPLLWNDDEVASSLASPNERFRQYKVSNYVEKITNRRIQIQPQVGTTLFTIDSIPSDGGIPASIVNEGFGINQLLYLLTICLSPQYKIVAIEEPEIHLHPSMVRELARAMAEIALQEDRCLVVSTHSEAFVVALLSHIAAGKIPLEDVSFIFAENLRGETTFEICEATQDGQIKGGLKPFMAGEVEDIASFLGLGQ